MPVDPLCSPLPWPLPAVVGVLKGYDQLLNLVLDESVEYLRGAPVLHLHLPPLSLVCLAELTESLTSLVLADPEDPLRVTDNTRSLGLIVCRGTSVMLVSPTDGTEEIQNPFGV